MFFKKKRLRDAKYLKSFNGAKCIACGVIDASVVAAHIRHGHTGGMGLKPPDNLTLPLCCNCHREQHEIGEGKFYKKHLGCNMSYVKAIAVERYEEWRKG